MKVHELKSWPSSFNAIWWDMKTADIRRDDRGYAAGDIVRLQEWEPDDGTARLTAPPGDYTGRLIDAEVRHVERGFGVPDGYAVLSLRVRRRSL